MSDPCRRPIQTDRHGHPPIGVSSCPVGEIRRWGVSACGVVSLLKGAGSISSVEVVPFWFRVGNTDEVLHPDAMITPPYRF